MKFKIYLFLIIALFFFVKPGMVLTQSKYTGQTIEQILAMPEDSINLGIACLVLAKDAYPNLKIEFYDYCLNYMVERIRYLDQGKTNPLVRIGVMNQYLYKPGWWNDSVTFTYNLNDLEADSTRDQFLNGYIASKLGSCVTMSMLHLVLAERLGWPIKPVRSAKHFYCRYIKKGFKENNIEATCGGGYIPSWRYAKDAGESKEAVKNGIYERVLTKKEYIANLLDENARYFREKKNDLDKAIYYTRLALSYDSTYVGAYWNLGELYREKAIELDSTRYERIQDVKRNYQILEQNMIRPSPSQVNMNQNPLFTPPDPTNAINMNPGTFIPGQFQKRRNPQEQFLDQFTRPSLPQVGVFQNQTKELFPNPSAPYMNQGFVEPSPLQKKPNNPYNQFPVNQNPNMQRQNGEIDMMEEIAYIDASYGKKILNLIDISHKLKAKAKELGVVLKFPKEFFIKQAESIEKFKRTGEY